MAQGEERRRVLVTGAAGHIGAYFAEHSREKYALRLMVRAGDGGVAALRAFGEVVTGDLDDLVGLKAVCAGMDTVVHMAGDPNPSAAWPALRAANIDGVYNIFVAAKSAGCRRVIHASSIHAVSGYPVDVQVKTGDPVNPGDLYGVSKCFGEAMARYMAEQEGLSAISIRIGAFQPIEAVQDGEGGLKMLDSFVSRRDLTQLLQRCVDVEGVQFAILHGLSDNRFKRLDISDARALVGYAPEDDATELNPNLRDLHLREVIAPDNVVGGQKPGIREDV